MSQIAGGKMRNIMSDQQYQQLVAKANGSNLSSQLLVAQSHPHNLQYLSRKLYGERSIPSTDPYYGGASSFSTASNGLYPAQVVAASKADTYLSPESKVDLRAAQMGSDRRSLVPSPALLDYPAYVDHVTARAALSATPISSDVGAYTFRNPSPQQGQQGANVVDLASQSELLARARRSELSNLYPGCFANGVQRLTRDEDHRAVAAQAGILGAGVGRGRHLERYLLAVQPDKLVRYASSCLVPEPDLRRDKYTIMGSNAMADDDRYSNYRRAKARRIGSNRDSSPGSRRGREREIYGGREERREKRGGASRGLGKSATQRRSKNVPLSKEEEANHEERVTNSNQPSERSGQNKRRLSGNNLERDLPEQASGAKQKEGNDDDSDEDSELGSLCAALSDSEEDKLNIITKKKKSESETAKATDGSLPGMIFGCSSATFHECMKLQLFGLPAKSKDEVLRVCPGTKVFLFNFDTKELSGIFEAVSHGGWQLQPDAFRGFGGFPAQVHVCLSEQCPNLTPSEFKPAIKDNYVNQHKFRFDLTSKQVKDLIRAFRQAERAQALLPDDLANHYFNERIQPEDYSRIIGQPQRPYSRQHQARFGPSRLSYAKFISMSGKTNIHESKRASKRALKRRKKRKVSNISLSPKADNCSFNNLSGEIQEADVTVNASKSCGCKDSTNKNPAVIVRDCIETDNSKNIEQSKEIVGTSDNFVANDMDSLGLGQSLSLSKPEEILQPQSNIGKQDSFVEDSHNDGTFRLAGGRAEEHGLGQGLDLLKGASSICGNVIQSFDSTPLSCMGDGSCKEIQGVSSANAISRNLINLGIDEIQALSSRKGDQLHPLNIVKDDNQEFLRKNGSPNHMHGVEKQDVETKESIMLDVESDISNDLPIVGIDEVFVKNLQDETVLEVFHIGPTQLNEVPIEKEIEDISEDDANQDLSLFGMDKDLDRTTGAKIALDNKDPLVQKDLKTINIVEDALAAHTITHVNKERVLIVEELIAPNVVESELQTCRIDFKDDVKDDDDKNDKVLKSSYAMESDDEIEAIEVSNDSEGLNDGENGQEQREEYEKKIHEDDKIAEDHEEDDYTKRDFEDENLEEDGEDYNGHTFI